MVLSIKQYEYAYRSSQTIRGASLLPISCFICMLLFAQHNIITEFILYILLFDALHSLLQKKFQINIRHHILYIHTISLIVYYITIAILALNTGQDNMNYIAAIILVCVRFIVKYMYLFDGTECVTFDISKNAINVIVNRNIIQLYKFDVFPVILTKYNAIFNNTYPYAHHVSRTKYTFILGAIIVILLIKYSLKTDIHPVSMYTLVYVIATLIVLQCIHRKNSTYYMSESLHRTYYLWLYNTRYICYAMLTILAFNIDNCTELIQHIATICLCLMTLSYETAYLLYENKLQNLFTANKAIEIQVKQAQNTLHEYIFKVNTINEVNKYMSIA